MDVVKKMLSSALTALRLKKKKKRKGGQIVIGVISVPRYKGFPLLAANFTLQWWVCVGGHGAARLRSSAVSFTTGRGRLQSSSVGRRDKLLKVGRNVVPTSRHFNGLHDLQATLIEFSSGLPEEEVERKLLKMGKVERASSPHLHSWCF